MEKSRIFVSACLLGHAVRYDGRSKSFSHPLIKRWMEEGRIVTLCPEMAAGLPVPRPPAEIEPGADAAGVLGGEGRVFENSGGDVTAAFVAGADMAGVLADREGCRYALLTDGSPSCGSRHVHAGRFDGQRIAGEGVVAARLKAAGISVFPESEIEELAVLIALEETRALSDPD
ncbi:MAG: purine-nucleoside phosphorylase [Rhizobiales bacterium]|nr:purine-nucleoside phosphorylase [Hyphomicrobiales bacterium]MBA67835.1 purine-nucleoside phosphorylase [Hyphomicrobiales bacterium]